MAIPMTKVEGVPDRVDDTRPGMAYFCGTGPSGMTCGYCRFRGYNRTSKKGRWDEALKAMVYNTYRSGGCEKFLKLSGHNGSTVDRQWAACKFFEAKP